MSLFCISLFGYKTLLYKIFKIGLASSLRIIAVFVFILYFVKSSKDITLRNSSSFAIDGFSQRLDFSIQLKIHCSLSDFIALLTRLSALETFKCARIMK